MACQRARHFTRTLQAVALGAEQAPKEVLDVADVARAAAAFARELLPGAFDVVVTETAKDTRVQAQRGAFHTALWNLIANARDASPRGGRVELYVAPEAPGFVMLGCKDEGTGLHHACTWDDVVRPHVSVNRPGHRAGLGLAQVCAFAHDCGGHVRNHPTVRGLDVQIVLPLARSAY